MFRGRPTAPFWFVLLLGVSSALLLRLVLERIGPAVPGDTAGPDVQLAFWNFIVAAAGLIFKGLQVAGQAVLTALQWSVKALWAFAIATNNAALGIGKLVVRGFQKAWDFLRLTYDNVLKPAWQKFWKIVDWAHDTLARLFQPILSFLDRIRGWVLGIYNEYVRPILDVIGVVRRALRILAALGVDWARALDRKLAELEEKIQLPFTWVIGKLNEIVNVIDRVVTADGLFQRLALIRSVERDMRYVGRAFVNWRSAPITADDFAELRRQVAERTPEQQRAELEATLLDNPGPYRSLVSELSANGRRVLEGR